jgi:hypothetical protein
MNSRQKPFENNKAVIHELTPLLMHSIGAVLHTLALGSNDSGSLKQSHCSAANKAIGAAQGQPGQTQRPGARRQDFNDFFLSGTGQKIQGDGLGAFAFGKNLSLKEKYP